MSNEASGYSAMSYEYDQSFFDYIESGAARSARVVVSQMQPLLSPRSVLDLGCGRGAWVAAWLEAGVRDAVGVDGDYVDRERLCVPETSFVASNLTQPFDLEKRFDLAQSLEVAEHLPPDAAETFVDSLCRHSDLVLFSAAVTGQGGENHLNERPLEYWRMLFAKRGYAPFDVLRPALRTRRDVEPWYRYNVVLYANPAGVERLPERVLRAGVSADERIREGGNPAWRMRRALVRLLPRRVVTLIARIKGRALVFSRVGFVRQK